MDIVFEDSQNSHIEIDVIYTTHALDRIIDREINQEDINCIISEFVFDADKTKIYEIRKPPLCVVTEFNPQANEAVILTIYRGMIGNSFVDHQPLSDILKNNMDAQQVLSKIGYN